MAGKKRSVLITGVSHSWGKNLVPLLEQDPEFDPIIGIDFEKPKKPFKRLEFFQVDLHTPLLAELLQVARVDTVCHLLFLDSYTSNEEHFDQNVMGTMDLLAACSAAETKRLIIKSSTKVYGAQASNPNYISEDADLKGQHQHRYIQDRVELEKMVRRFSRSNPIPEITVLRFANILGRTVDTPVMRYLDSNIVPTCLGHDPLFQFTHEQDVLAALYHTIKSDVTGTFNISGDGVLPLSQILRIGGKVPLPLPSPLMRASSMILRPGGRQGLTDSIPIETDYIMYNCLGDTARMKKVLKFKPHFSSKETVKEFFEHLRIRKYLPSRNKIQSDPQSSERMQAWIQARQRASNYLSNLIEDFNKEEGYDQ
ncbi:NAD-dependent epimerase/dehydratase family protein [Desulfatibacillum aliphaticivorans]|uniref:NAD-dependent epimerase/dehydratase family protein n=1 Tax=Desulfatibacillum aliphaticivorans TaxID=218208 RepID=UPI00040DB20C|nr:NAD-dependent epimerase/dehydratase family protein [Desulfatibacillum aliphaticivorans]